MRNSLLRNGTTEVRIGKRTIAAGHGKSSDHVIRTEENLQAVIQYIMNNPVRKGIVEKADQYPYSEWFDIEIKRYL